MSFIFIFIFANLFYYIELCLFYHTVPSQIGDNTVAGPQSVAEF